MRLVYGLLASAALACARTVSYTLDITNGYVSPDGFERPVVLVNGQTPGPVLRADKGDDMVVRVNNRLSDTRMHTITSIHWHGLFQHRTAHEDGVAFITQCPIARNNSYTYRFSTGGQTGTHWYHSHMSSQYTDGLRGPLIIYDHEGDPHRDLYDIDDESTIISISDWFHSPADQLRADWMANKIAEPPPDANLFNGLGRYQSGPLTPRPVYHVEYGKRYRLRLINMGAVANYNFTIEGHSFQVIEVDGVSHHPITATALALFPGQRYSVILNANQTIANYWIAYPGNFRELALPKINPHFNGSEAFAILRYKGAPDSEPETPTFQPDIPNMLTEDRLRPLHSPLPPTDEPYVVNLSFVPADGGTPLDYLGGTKKWLINNVQFVTPTVPLLLEVMTGSKTVNRSDPSRGIYVLPRNRTIDVRLIGDWHHPWHLHGHNFQVVQAADGVWNDVDPLIRDTVMSSNALDTETPGPVTFRFRTDNPGPWLLHCHKDWHLEAGLAVVFIESPEDQRTGPDAIKPDPEWEKLCMSYHNYADPGLDMSADHFAAGRPCHHPPCVVGDSNEETQEIIVHPPSAN